MADTASIIRQCNCTQNSQGSTQGAEFQDRVLGVGRRFYTSSPTGGTERCTVCSKAHKKGS